MSADPLSLLLLASGGLSAAGTLSGSRSDARTLRQKAQISRDQASADEQTQRREGRQAIGKQAAAQAESGTGIDEGVLKQSTIAAEIDALNIRYGGEIQSGGLLKAARATKRQGSFLAGAQLLSGVSSAFAFSRRVK